jgi:hypothetical protein
VKKSLERRLATRKKEMDEKKKATNEFPKSTNVLSGLHNPDSLQQILNNDLR